MNNNYNSTENSVKDSELHQNFLHVVYQVNNIACLMEQKDDGSISAEYVTPSFVKLMECDTQEQALELMDGENLFANTMPEDHPILRDILANHYNISHQFHNAHHNVSHLHHSLHRILQTILLFLR